MKSWPTCDCVISPTEMLDKLQEKVGETLGRLADEFGSLNLARSGLLDRVTNGRDRAVYEVLIKFITQKPSKRGFRSGNRAGRVTERDKYLIKEHAKWQTDHPKGSDRQFAVWYHKNEFEWWSGLELPWARKTKKDATEADIRRITKLLRDARKRMEHQSTD